MMDDTSNKTPMVDLAPGGWLETPTLENRASSPQSAATTRGTTRVASPLMNNTAALEPKADKYMTVTGEATEEPDDELPQGRNESYFMPLRAGPSRQATARHSLTSGPSALSRANTEDDMIHSLSRQLTSNSLSRRRTSNSISRRMTQEEREERNEIERLLSRMFGKSRQAISDEEKSRHVGVVWKDLVVQGMGLGAALQPSVGDVFMTGPRKISALFSKNKTARTKAPVRSLIDRFTGCIRPGEMLLVLGRPGAGCSTFLKVLGNQRFGYVDVKGEITYGGVDAQTMLKMFHGEVLYNPEDDLHYPTLKVKDTLKFALTTKAPGQESRKEGETKKDYIREFLRVVSKLFWIEHTMNTKVGDAFIRGVSGGEKKRVSIAEAMVTRASTQCWDNSTKGLDASSALEYVSSLRTLTSMTHISTAVALYQAGETLYDLFDKVILIDQGKCCYFGPADTAADYFKTLGFVQLERWTTADFLTSVVDEHERNIKPGYEERIPRSAEQFSEAFLKSDVHANNIKEIHEFEQETQNLLQERGVVQGGPAKKNYAISFPAQVWACTTRQWLVMLGDRQSLAGKWGGILFQALIVGSLFYDLPSNARGIFTRGGVLFFMLLFNALLALAELNTTFNSLPILMKHKSFSFYRPAAYALAQTVIDVPLVLVQNVIFVLVVYFMANLQRTAAQFFICLLFLFSITMTMYAFFRAVAATVGSLDHATRITGISLQILIVYTGYLIPPRKMRPWFAWLRYINPVQYGFEGVMANEFYNLDIECVAPYIVPVVPGASPGFQTCAIQGSTPGSLTVSGANYIDVAFTYRRSHLWRNLGFIWAFFLFFVFLTCLGLELQKPNKGGGSITIYKRGQAPKTVEQAIVTTKPANSDEESGFNEKHSAAAMDDSDSDVDQDPQKTIARNDMIFTFQNVNYTIPYQGGERVLLDNIQGFVQPGKLTALMGSSGAGKTTLLNALAQRLSFGVITGDFLVDGKPLPASFQRSSGFAEQQDIHEPTATVREALRFSAKLRQPREIPLQEKYDYCETIIELLEMQHFAGAIVGEVGNGLNAEQRKRLTIAVELASKPELLMFLDEPTSGLDSSAAFNILRFLRKLADAGQAILCTIHQPNSVLFENFDRILLLKSGGQTVYFGDLGKNSQKLIGYFEKNGARQCGPDDNPAEYMLTAIGAGDPDYNGPDWAEIWRNSEDNRTLTREIEGILEKTREKSAPDSAKDDREYAMPQWTQVKTVTQRSFTAMWRSKDYVMGMFILHAITGLFNSFTFWHLDYSNIDMQSRLFSVFMTLTICPPLIQQLQPRFLKARNIFSSREYKAKIYGWPAFVTGAIASEIPYRIVAGTLYWCCWYWPTWFPRDTYTSVSSWAMIMVFEMFYLGFGQAIAAISPNEMLASLIVPILFTFIVSFCGVVAPYATLPTFWKSWMYWITPFRYLVEAMLSLITTNLPIECATSELAIFSAPNGNCQEYAGSFAQQSGGRLSTLPDGRCGYCQYQTGDQYLAGFNMYATKIWRDYGIVWAYVVFQFMIVFLGTWIYMSGGSRIKRLFRGKTKPRKNNTAASIERH